MDMRTRASKEQELRQLERQVKDGVITKKQLGYIIGLEKLYIEKDERIDYSELKRMTKVEASQYIEGLKQIASYESIL